MKILITGGAGFIGSNLAKHALAAGHQVSILDDLSTGYIENIDKLDIKFTHASILDDDALAHACDGAEEVVHLAALGSVPRSIAAPLATHEVNATGTLHVLQAARVAGVSHVTYSSSSSVYGMNPALPKHEREWIRALSPYAASKLAAEQYVLSYQQSYGMSTIAFRFFNVYGPGQRAGHPYAAVIPTFVNAIIHNDTITINGDGSNSRDFTYVGTVCEALLKTIERKITHPEPVNLAFGTNTSLSALVAKLAEVAAFSARLDYGPERPGDVPHSQAASGNLLALLPDLLPEKLEIGLHETLQWFKDNE